MVRPALRYTNLSSAEETRESHPMAVTVAPNSGARMRGPQSPDNRNADSNNTASQTGTWKSSIMAGMRTLRNLFNWSPSSIAETSQAAVGNRTNGSQQSNQPNTQRSTASPRVTPERPTGCAHQREILVSSEGPGDKSNYGQMITGTATPLTMVPQSKLSQLMTITAAHRVR